MYAATGGTMSVNGQMANISFAAYLRDCMNNQPNSLYHHYRTRPSQPLPLQTTNNSHPIFGACYGPLFKPAVLHTPFDRYPQLASSYNMAAEEPGYFKEYVRDPEELYLPTDVVPAPASYCQAAPAWPSWSTSSSTCYAFPGTTPQNPFKVEGSPSLHVPSVLPQNVDASKYESLSYDDWYSAPTLYQSSSPSSTEYNTNSPTSSGDNFSDFSFSYHSTRSTQEHVPLSPAFHLPLQTILDSTYRMTPAFPTMAKQTTYSMPHGLPFGNYSLSSSAYERPVYAQFHHHHMMERSPSSDELDVQTPSEADDDQHDDPSFASSPSQTYMLTESGVDARQRRDEILVSMRNEGHSYRDIKRLGRFKEAESTLRGRYRALTKDKEERVRKPQWHATDETLLRQAVRHYTHGPNHKTKMKYGRRKLPWKKISQRMKDHGSSYLFAPATCAKKWESLGK